MSQSFSIQTERPVAVGLFDGESEARQAIQAVRGLGLPEAQLAFVAPGALAPSASQAEPKLASSDGTGLLGAGGDLTGALVSLGIPEGEARFYAREVQAGRALIVVQATAGAYTQARDLLRQHGARDVQSHGKDLVRGSDTSDGVSGGTTSLDADLTDRWEDVRSRYETLFEQHYGTSDTSWPEIEPLYRHAWQMANAPALRGRPWSEVQARLERDWEAQPGRPAWSEAAGPIRDVWEDVAAESTTPEGGAERRVARQGADQSGPARDVVPPSGPA